MKQRNHRAALAAAACALFLAPPALAQAPAAGPAAAFRNLSAEESRALATGQTLFRQPSNWRGLSMPADAPFYKEIEDELRKGGHNYVGEVIMVLPRERAEALIPMLREKLLNFEGYAGIPYWSHRQERFYDLFDWVRVSVGPSPGTRGAAGKAETLQYMEPFGEYGSAYEWDFGPAALRFAGVNTSALSYDGVRAVAPGNLIWRLRAYRSGEHWVFYGLGAVKAFDMLGLLRDRLSASFMGRIEAFFKYAYAQVH
jgi:hypothetical protein